MKQSLGISILRVTATVFVVLFHSLGYYTNAWPFDGIKINAYNSFCDVLNQITSPPLSASPGYSPASLEKTNSQVYYWENV